MRREHGYQQDNITKVLATDITRLVTVSYNRKVHLKVHFQGQFEQEDRRLVEVEGQAGQLDLTLARTNARST